MSLPLPMHKDEQVRCERCHKLLCKRLPNGRLEIKWTNLTVICPAPATIHCPRCGEPNDVN